MGGPVVVQGSMTGNSTTVNGNLYYLTGTNSGVTVTGTAYNYVPSFAWPTFDTSYYAANAGTTTTSAADDRF